MVETFLEPLAFDIEKAYGTYVPRVDYPTLVRRMLAVVPDACLDGIEKIDLRAGTKGNRAHRRAKHRSRGKKYLNKESLGLYYPRAQSKAPYIVLHVDNLDNQYEYSVPILGRIMSESDIAETLFHEIGHHIHLTKHRENRERENVADNWADFYRIRYMRKQFWWLRVLLRPIFVPIRLYWRMFNRERYERRVRRYEKFRRMLAIEKEIIAAYERVHGTPQSQSTG